MFHTFRAYEKGVVILFYNNCERGSVILTKQSSIVFFILTCDFQNPSEKGDFIYPHVQIVEMISYALKCVYISSNSSPFFSQIGTLRLFLKSICQENSNIISSSSRSPYLLILYPCSIDSTFQGLCRTYVILSEDFS